MCVPLITWSVLAALWAASPSSAYVGIALALAFYVWLSPAIAIGMLGIVRADGVSADAAGSSTLAAAAAVFVLAWIGQFIGHAIEGRKPSFFEDVKFLLIGPAVAAPPHLPERGNPLLIGSRARQPIGFIPATSSASCSRCTCAWPVVSATQTTRTADRSGPENARS